MALRRRRGDNGLNAWPGYVDALSTLLMVIIFVLLVFVLAQAFLSVALTGRDKQLDRVNRQLAEVSDMLSLERGRGADLQQSIAQLNRELATASAARDTLSQQLAALQTQAERATADRDTLRSERDRLAQQLADAALQARPVPRGWSGCSRISRRRPAAPMPRSRRPRRLRRSLPRRDGSSATHAGSPMHGRSLPRCRRQIAELDKTVQANKDTIAARLSDLAKLAQQNRALAALRDDAGEAGAGRGRARDDGPAASCRGRGAACRREEARRFGEGPDRACSISRWTS